MIDGIPSRPAKAGVNRRAVLGIGAAAGTAALLAACTSPAAEETTSAGSVAASSMTPGEAARLRAQIRGRVLLPGEPGYTEEVATYNLTATHRPAVVVAAATAADVQVAVRFARDKKLPVGVMATGHQNSVPINGGLLVSTKAMRNLVLDADRRTARAEAGVRWDQVVQETTTLGLAPLNGSTGGVSVVGYTVGGGLSPTLGRAFGYAADHVTSLNIVTADGQLRTVTATNEPELFFAARGGKSNFGIVTAIEFGLFPVTTLYAGNLFFPGERAKEVLDAYRKWVTTVPEAMSSSVALMRIPPGPSAPEPLRGKFVITVRVSYAGSAATGAALIKPLRAIGPTVVDSVAEIPYAAFASIHADPTDPVPAYERTALLRELSAATVDELVAVAGPTAAVPLTMVEVRHLGGALGRPPSVPNAVSNRDAAFTLFTAAVGGPADAAAIKQQQDQLIQRMRPWSTGSTYVNFLSTAESSVQQVRTAFTPETYNRLIQLKRRFDPTNMFRFNHNITPA